MEFRDWLDAGWVFMTREASTPVRTALNRIAGAETEDEVEAGIDALKAVIEAETAARERYEREQRRRDGTHVLIDERQAASAADMFNEARRVALEPEG